MSYGGDAQLMNGNASVEQVLLANILHQTKAWVHE